MSTTSPCCAIDNHCTRPIHTEGGQSDEVCQDVLASQLRAECQQQAHVVQLIIIAQGLFTLREINLMMHAACQNVLVSQLRAECQ
jgi:hypothetical protein